MTTLSTEQCLRIDLLVGDYFAAVRDRDSCRKRLENPELDQTEKYKLNEDVFAFSDIVVDIKLKILNFFQFVEGTELLTTRNGSVVVDGNKGRRHVRLIPPERSTYVKTIHGGEESPIVLTEIDETV